MMPANDRPEVVENIKAALADGDFYRKVEPNDPTLTAQQSAALVERFTRRLGTAGYAVKSALARSVAALATIYINRDTEIVGAEFLENLDGAIVTSNHFAPFENTVIRRLAINEGHRLRIVSQVTNLAMTGVLGFLMNYADVVPIYTAPHYLERQFMPILRDAVDSGNWVLIYPEQEMWYNYRKPRPPRIGAYRFAAKLSVPIVSCFVEIIDGERPHKVRYRLHILDVLTPDGQKSIRESSTELAEHDYKLKCDAYRRIYGREVSYGFEADDIAGCAEVPK